MIYQVIKDNTVFYVQDEEKALKYLDEGYEVFKQTKLVIGNDGKIQEDSSTVKGEVIINAPKSRMKK